MNNKIFAIVIMYFISLTICTVTAFYYGHYIIGFIGMILIGCINIGQDHHK